MVALSGAFGQDYFRPPLDTALADPLGGAGGAPRAAGGAAGTPAVALAPLPLAADAPPLGGFAPLVAPKGAAGPAPAAPSLPLLPPTGTHAGPAHRGPLAPKTRPSALDPGPGPMAVTCTLTLQAPAFVPVNADDDNGSAITNGIPAQRDFDVAPIPNGGKGDPDLLPASVTVGCNVPGELTWSLYQIGTGRIALWTDSMKSAPAASVVEVPPGQHKYTFSIEGTHESSFLNDVTLDFGFTFNITGTPQVVGASQDMSVTPLINNFTATPAGGATGQNIVFAIANGQISPDGRFGIQAATPQMQPGIQFDASVNWTNLRGDLTLIQDYMGLMNGPHMPTNYKGQAVGWLFAPGSTDAQNNPVGAAVWQIADSAPFPLLDANPTDTVPDYPTNPNTTVPNVYTISATDSPSTGYPNVAVGRNTQIDAISTLTMWLCWRFTEQTGQGLGTFDYYPIAKLNWQVDWLAHASAQQTGPVDTIDWLHGVSADDAFVRTNQPPPAMSTTTTVGNPPKTVSNVFNYNNVWVPIN